jgi:hypothetical protein
MLKTLGLKGGTVLSNEYLLAQVSQRVNAQKRGNRDAEEFLQFF